MTEGKRPNILFIMADDHGAQAMSCYNSRINVTPNLDRIAAQGMRLDRCFCANSICAPSRATILTGLHSHKNGVKTLGDRIDNRQLNFAKLLQAAGYQTAVVGKWHLGEHMTPQGYDYSEVLIGQGPYYNPPMLCNGEKVNHTGYTTDIITDLALQWLQDKRDPDKPFMLMYQHKAPHRNWQPGPEQLTNYDDVTIPEPDTLFDDYATRGTPAKAQDMSIAVTMNPGDLKLTPPRNLTPQQKEKWDAAYGPKNEAFRKANLEGRELVRWKYQRYMKDYLRCIDSVDQNLGRVLNYLDSSGLAENTVVIYSSDQGFYLGEHGWFDKRWIYEESLRTPLIVRWPGAAQPGSVNKDIVSNLDFAETFLEIAGAEVPGDMQGRGIVPLLRGKTPADWRKYFYYHYYEFPGAHSVRRHFGVADGRFKLIRFHEPDVDQWEMYDLAADPKEVKNVHGDPQYAADQTRLEENLARLRKQLRVSDLDPIESYRGGMERYQKGVEQMKAKCEKLGI